MSSLNSWRNSTLRIRRETLMLRMNLDLNMLVIIGGRERTRTEFHAVLDAANFELTRIIPTMAPQSIIEGVPKVGRSVTIRDACASPKRP